MTLPTSYQGLTDHDLLMLLREVAESPGVLIADEPAWLHLGVPDVVAAARARWGWAETHDIEALFDPFVMGRQGKRHLNDGSLVYAIPLQVALWDDPAT